MAVDPATVQPEDRLMWHTPGQSTNKIVIVVRVLEDGRALVDEWGSTRRRTVSLHNCTRLIPLSPESGK